MESDYQNETQKESKKRTYQQFLEDQSTLPATAPEVSIKRLKITQEEPLSALDYFSQFSYAKVTVRRASRPATNNRYTSLEK